MLMMKYRYDGDENHPQADYWQSASETLKELKMEECLPIVKIMHSL